MEQNPWPRKVDVFGVQITETNYAEVVDLIIDQAMQNKSFVVDFFSVDALVLASSNPELREIVNSFEIVCPDGHPVRHAMNLLHHSKLNDRVCGPDTMMKLLERAGLENVPVYFYGSTDPVLSSLVSEAKRRFPALIVAGSYSPPFRPLTDEEAEEIVSRINASGAKLTFIGLGAPRQSLFANAYRGKIQGALLCTGAAFDFIAGTKKRAPKWLQKTGLEWSYRLMQEPRRLFLRYTVNNSRYFILLLKALVKHRVAESNHHNCPSDVLKE